MQYRRENFQCPLAYHCWLLLQNYIVLCKVYSRFSSGHSQNEFFIDFLRLLNQSVLSSHVHILCTDQTVYVSMFLSQAIHPLTVLSTPCCIFIIKGNILLHGRVCSIVTLSVYNNLLNNLFILPAYQTAV